jgi:[acyl-carrier-protein] S-malonyltransferase
MSYAFLFPGQGSQSVGMLSGYAEVFPVVSELFNRASDLLATDLWSMTQQGPLELLSLTENTQPALLTAGYVTWRIWQELGGPQPTVMAGHSLGEFTALVCAGALEFEDAVLLVRDRGRFMQEAVPAGEGAMAVIIGLDDSAVIEACSEYSAGEVLQAVNFNAPGQVVVAGSTAAVQRLADAAKDIGARRVMPLPVSIPAHSDLMTPAAEALAGRLMDLNISRPAIPVIHNVNARISENGAEVAANLIAQADSPVRWVETIKTIVDGGTRTFVESGPGKVLGGIIKRIDRNVEIYSLEDPDKMQAAIEGL